MVRDSSAQAYWRKVLDDVGVFWTHDGDRRRPYAQLTDKLISDLYSDMTFALSDGVLIKLIAQDLAKRLRTRYPDLRHVNDVLICGQANGSVALASQIASELGCGWFNTVKIGDGSNQMKIDDRYIGIHDHTKITVVVDDSTFSGGTSNRSRLALERAGFLNVSPVVLTGVDRTGGTNDFGIEIISCCQVNEGQTWELGNNPYTDDGKELVLPVRPKTEAGRMALHQTFLR